MATKIYLTGGAINIEGVYVDIQAINPAHFDWQVNGAIYTARDGVQNQTYTLGAVGDIQDESGTPYADKATLIAALNNMVNYNNFSQAMIPTYTGVNQTVQILTDGASIAFNIASGYNATLTVAGDRTMAAPNNIPTGGGGVITITCDGTDRTITWDAVYRFSGGGTQTAFVANSINEVMWYSPDGINVTITGVNYNVS